MSVLFRGEDPKLCKICQQEPKPQGRSYCRECQTAFQRWLRAKNGGRTGFGTVGEFARHVRAQLAAGKERYLKADDYWSPEPEALPEEDEGPKPWEDPDYIEWVNSR